MFKDQLSIPPAAVWCSWPPFCKWAHRAAFLRACNLTSRDLVILNHIIHFVFSFDPQCNHQYKQHPTYYPHNLEHCSLPSQNIRATAANRTMSRTYRSSGAVGASSRIIFDNMMGNYSAKPVDPCMSHCTLAMQGSWAPDCCSGTTFALTNFEIFPEYFFDPPDCC